MNNDLKFWIRVIFYILILAALIFAGVRGGGDPCTRCSFQPTVGDEVTCREAINYYAENKLGIGQTKSIYEDINLSILDGDAPPSDTLKENQNEP